MRSLLGSLILAAVSVPMVFAAQSAPAQAPATPAPAPAATTTPAAVSKTPARQKTVARRHRKGVKPAKSTKKAA